MRPLLCTGRPPFVGDTTGEVLQSVREDTPPDVWRVNPAVPNWLGEIIGRLHARTPAERFDSAEAVDFGEDGEFQSLAAGETP